jgi:hypothetical protein
MAGYAAYFAGYFRVGAKSHTLGTHYIFPGNRLQ